MSIKVFIATVKRDYNIIIKESKAYRTKKLPFDDIKGVSYHSV